MTEKTRQTARLEKQRFWKVHIRAWERSGFSQNEYCRCHKLKAPQFTYWKTKYNQEDITPVSFVPVPVAPIHQITNRFDSSDSGVTVLLGALQLKISKDFNPSCLVKVVSALEERS